MHLWLWLTRFRQVQNTGYKNREYMLWAINPDIPSGTTHHTLVGPCFKQAPQSRHRVKSCLAFAPFSPVTLGSIQLSQTRRIWVVKWEYVVGSLRTRTRWRVRPQHNHQDSLHPLYPHKHKDLDCLRHERERAVFDFLLRMKRQTVIWLTQNTPWCHSDAWARECRA